MTTAKLKSRIKRLREARKMVSKVIEKVAPIKLNDIEDENTADAVFSVKSGLDQVLNEIEAALRYDTDLIKWRE